MMLCEEFNAQINGLKNPFDKIKLIKKFFGEYSEFHGSFAYQDDFEDTTVLTIKQRKMNVTFLSLMEALEYFYNSNAKLSLDMTPYWRKFIDLLNQNKDTQIFFVKKGAQIGASVFFTNLMLAFQLLYRLPVMYVGPCRALCNSIRRMLITNLKMLNIGIIHTSEEMLLAEHNLSFNFGYSTSIRTLRSKAISYVFCDEVSLFPTDISKEGDILSLMLARTATFANSRKLFFFSTPKVYYDSFDRLTSSAEQHAVYKVKCQECGHYFELTPKLLTEDEHVICNVCFSLTPKSWAVTNGQFEMLKDRTATPKSITIKITGVDSLLTKNRAILEQYQMSNNDKLFEKTFKQTVLAEEVSPELTAPIPSVKTKLIEYDYDIYAADPHIKDVHVLHLVHNSATNEYCVDDLLLLSHSEFFEFMDRIDRPTAIDIGYIDVNKLLRETTLRHKLILVRGDSYGLNRIDPVRYVKSGNHTFYSVSRQRVFIDLFRMISTDKIWLSDQLNTDFQEKLLKCFQELRYIKTNSGHHKWMVSESSHELTHHFDCLIYAFALLTWNKIKQNRAFPTTASNCRISIFQKNDSAKGQNSNKRKPMRIL